MPRQYLLSQPSGNTSKLIWPPADTQRPTGCRKRRRHWHHSEVGQPRRLSLFQARVTFSEAACRLQQTHRWKTRVLFLWTRPATRTQTSLGFSPSVGNKHHRLHFSSSFSFTAKEPNRTFTSSVHFKWEQAQNLPNVPQTDIFVNYRWRRRVEPGFRVSTWALPCPARRTRSAPLACSCVRSETRSASRYETPRRCPWETTQSHMTPTAEPPQSWYMQWFWPFDLTGNTPETLTVSWRALLQFKQFTLTAEPRPQPQR